MTVDSLQVTPMTAPTAPVGLGAPGTPGGLGEPERVPVRRDVEGLRAGVVLLVVAYHAGVRPGTGG